MRRGARSTLVVGAALAAMAAAAPRARTSTPSIWTHAPAAALRLRPMTRLPPRATRRPRSRSPGPAAKPVTRTIPVPLLCSTEGRRRRSWRTDCRRRWHRRTPPRAGSRPTIISRTSSTFRSRQRRGPTSPRPRCSSSPPRSLAALPSPTFFRPATPFSADTRHLRRVRRCNPRKRSTCSGTSGAAGTGPFPASRPRGHYRRRRRLAAAS